MITTILFDVDNTLIDFHECARLAIMQSFKQCKLPFDNHILQVFEKTNDLLWHKYDLGELTREKLFEIRWQTIFDEVKIDYPGTKFEQIFLKNLGQQSIKIDGADEILAYLKPKYTLCAASNAPYALQMSRLNLSGLIKYFDHIFISEKIGYQKPTKQFFDFCFDTLGNPQKQQVIIIGDSPIADMAGGKNYGIKTCWFNRYATGKQSDADFCIDSLEQIKDIL